MFKKPGRMILISFVVIVFTLWVYGYKIYPPGSGFSEPSMTQTISAFFNALIALVAGVVFIISFIVLIWNKIKPFFIKQKDQT
ncbi:hypothetical protein C0581_03425 [Candidatus Parcubacteria bacterium]|nr:MAG: hypothetical protein C0581_03425 [Candidatus Parcubacteria bacterium]